MSQVRYSKDHEYISVEGDVGTIGISEHAQAQLGDVVFVELPAVGDKLAKGAQAAVVESVKAASEVFSPVSGEVVAINSDLESEPSLINEDALGKGWILKLKLSDPAEVTALMDEAAYQDFLKSIA
ncbi:glycine cleavage system protein GcvH [Methylocapsa sp. S129]|uniref:glycine cleavage system protein GcvH n=1 Tax=Methylocapsa sp. S129 TaxID=1641869 RepID=UPI00131C7F14|nr:glycine cleavage system protein GcvH [Methylocapsa sp. S129]